ncbi:MAG: hypothetical protein AB1689_07925 [Thermodesulfobacteriota bacterium]
MHRSKLALWTAVVAVALAIAPGATRAADTPDATSALTNEEFRLYARGRFESLQDAAHVTRNLAAKFRRQCSMRTSASGDGERACTVARAAQERRTNLLEEENELMHRIEARFGGVPSWARSADAEFRESLVQ